MFASTCRARPLIYVLLAAATLTSCAMTSPRPTSTESVAAHTQVTPAPALADECQALLVGLSEAQPLLAELKSTLDDQVPRIEKATRSATPVVVQQKTVADCPVGPDEDDEDKAVIGAIEWIYMAPPGKHYRARIDSGAETSSLSAREIVEFERDGEDWVRFSFDHDGSEDVVELELPIARTAMIRQASSASQRRVVVEIDVRFGDQLQTTEFTLTDRSNMTYPVLLGRAFLMDLYIVDVARSYTRPKFQAKES